MTEDTISRANFGGTGRKKEDDLESRNQKLEIGRRNVRSAATRLQSGFTTPGGKV